MNKFLLRLIGIDLDEINKALEAKDLDKIGDIIKGVAIRLGFDQIGELINKALDSLATMKPVDILDALISILVVIKNYIDKPALKGDTPRQELNEFNPAWIIPAIEIAKLIFAWLQKRRK